MKIARRRDPVIVPKEPDCWWCPLVWLGGFLILFVLMPGRFESVMGLFMGFWLGATVVIQVFGRTEENKP